MSNIQDLLAKKCDANMSPINLSHSSALRIGSMFSLACLGDANLEIHGDVVSSGFDARDLYILL